jgi:exopolyphosphatase/guanosine-5'-triphosphate,3'-diphosphate pyrophosphatase
MVEEKLIRKAVIDLGTNTFNLLIAEFQNGTWRRIYAEKDGVSLGMGGINQKVITEDAIQRAEKALRHFKNMAESMGVSEIQAIGTSAIRDAKNQVEFVERIRRDIGIHITVISGEEEASYIYLGVKKTIAFEKPSLIMDIGGGSTEFILADKNGIQQKTSLNIGVSRIFQLFDFSDPITVSQVKKLEDWLEEQADGFFDTLQVDRLIGSSGSFETFYELIHNARIENLDESILLPFSEFYTELEKLIFTSQAERDLNPWIIPIRKKMAPFAAVKTKWIIDKLGIKETYLSPYSLKEGAL